MEMTLSKGSVKITSETIHQLLGIPNSGIDLVSMGTSTNSTELGLAWRTRYPKNLIGTTEIVQKIKEAKDDDGIMFKLDFLMLFYSTMVECHDNGKCKMDLIDLLKEDMDFGNIDWCSYVLSKIKVCKKMWRRRTLKSRFTGALSILTRGEEAGCNDEDDDVTEVPGMKSTFSKMNSIFDWIEEEKKRFEELMISRYKVNPESEEIINLYRRYVGCFKDLVQLVDENTKFETSVPHVDIKTALSDHEKKIWSYLMIREHEDTK
ncbi:hypothetical protein QVD17_42286 [Tagetes erecta]|uniref:Uncharacterized protein n=1 Tax=Tagetes erecta TaxID=13708 RepID=A0AAD8JKE8_TARER|nr:hypothetical protein QVD17_42286 [Tagetes erecta]